MKTERKHLISLQFHLSSTVGIVAATLLFGALAGSAQTSDYLFSGSEQTVTLSPGLYDITAYGAEGASNIESSYSGGLGAEMEGQFSFSASTTLTLLVGGGGLSYYSGGGGAGGGGGGGGSFVVAGSTPLVIAGGGGGGGDDGYGGPRLRLGWRRWRRRLQRRGRRR